MHRRECGLCDDMLEDLERLRGALAREGSPFHLPPVEVVDVDSDSELHRRYGLSVPVLLLDGTVVCRHRLDEAELTRLLSRRSA
ncbi:MAG: glutaredoxin family protein [Steroidobacteraceae bacterium]